MLYVSNLEKSIGFYTRAFDLQVTNRLVGSPDGERWNSMQIISGEF